MMQCQTEFHTKGGSSNQIVGNIKILGNRELTKEFEL